jgi:hypothetical protein
MLYIVVVTEDGEQFEYEYSNLTHAQEHYNNEEHAQLIEYKNGSHHLMDCK